MKLNELIREDDSFIQLDDFLEKKCSQFLEEIGDNEDDVFETAISALYRGMNIPGSPQKAELYGDQMDLYTKSVRKNREPRDTHPDISELLDELFQKKFGWKPRSQAVFCFARPGKNIVGDYGKAFAILPMGKFKYLWSPEVRDLTISVRRAFRSAGIKDHDIDEEYTKEELETARPILQNIVNTYVDNKLTDTIYARSVFEIMIGCDQFAAVAA